MVATVEENWLVRELFVPKEDSVEVTSPSDWAILVKKVVEVLPLYSLRGFSAPAALGRIFEFRELDEDSYFYGGPDDLRYCEGLSDTTHILYCCILLQIETSRTLRLKHLVMSRKGHFFIAESVWGIRNDPDPDSSGRSFNLKRVSFVPTTIETMCAVFSTGVRTFSYDQHSQSVGGATLDSFRAAVADTREKLYSQFHSLGRTSEMIHDVARRVGVPRR